MTTAAMNRLEIKIIRLPVWVLPLAAAAAVALVALAGVLGFGLLLLMSPIILVAGAVHMLRGRRGTKPVERPWQRPKRDPRLSNPPVIEGEYEVIDERSPKPAPQPRTDKP
jgi:hypothetical protein